LEPVTEQTEPVVLLPQCKTCGYALNAQSRFCPGCGTLQQEVTEAIPHHAFEYSSKILIAFYLVQLVVCLTVNKVDAFADYRNMVWAELFLAVWTLLFAAANWRAIVPLYSFKNVRIPLLLLCAAGAIVFSLGVNFATEWLNLEIFGQRMSYYAIYQDLEYSVPIFFLSIAVYPALFEELGFRGVMYNYVDAVAGSTNAIVISSMAFAIIHVSLLSLIWIVPFALAAAYFRYRYQTLWYGMVIHLFFNGTACVTELLSV